MASEANPLARHGGVSYLEIPALVPSQSAAFYAQLLGWQIDERSRDDFRFSDGEGLLIGRLVTGRAAAREPGLVPFIYVDDLARAVERVGVNGGEIVEAPRPEGDVRIASVRDPGGNVLDLWQFA